MGGPGAIFTGGPLWRISWRHRLENLFFVDSQRSRLLFPVVGYVPAVLTPLLAAIDYYKPHEMVLKINVSRTWLLTALEHRLPKPLRQARNQLGTPGGAESFPRGSQIFWTMSNIFKLCRTHFSRGGEQISRVFFSPCAPPGYGPALRCIRDVRVLVRFPYWWCLHHYNCLLFIIIPPVTDVHVMLKKIECERKIWSTKRSQGKTERHLYLSIKWKNKSCKPPLIVRCMKWWNKLCKPRFSIE